MVDPHVDGSPTIGVNPRPSLRADSKRLMSCLEK